MDRAEVAGREPVRWGLRSRQHHSGQGLQDWVHRSEAANSRPRRSPLTPCRRLTPSGLRRSERGVSLSCWPGLQSGRRGFSSFGRRSVRSRPAGAAAGRVASLRRSGGATISARQASQRSSLCQPLARLDPSGRCASAGTRPSVRRSRSATGCIRGRRSGGRRCSANSRSTWASLPQRGGGRSERRGRRQVRLMILKNSPITPGRCPVDQSDLSPGAADADQLGRRDLVARANSTPNTDGTWSKEASSKGGARRRPRSSVTSTLLSAAHRRAGSDKLRSEIEAGDMGAGDGCA